MLPTYQVRATNDTSPLCAAWESRLWQQADAAPIDNYHPASSDHRPDVTVRLLYDIENLYVRYRVVDRYVVARHLGFQAPVWRDSCVECFLQPKTERGYFNFEINCGGSLLLCYIEDPTRKAEGFARYTRVDEAVTALVEIKHTMPQRVEPEIDVPTTWEIACRIPLRVLETYVGPLGNLAGQEWRTNFYKCADDSSHPHWGSWSPIGEELNFHQPSYFGTLQFL